MPASFENDALLAPIKIKDPRAPPKTELAEKASIKIKFIVGIIL